MSTKEILEHNRSVMSSLVPGDLVEFPRYYEKINFYNHWAVFIGEGRVIHFSSPDGSDFGRGVTFHQALEMAHDQRRLFKNSVKEGDEPISIHLALATGRVQGSIFSSNNTILEGDFMTVAGDSKARKHDDMDPPSEWASWFWKLFGYVKPYPGDQVVKRAKSKLGEDRYNLLTNNCEHFANWCRYGVSVSWQVPFWLRDILKVFE